MSTIELLNVRADPMIKVVCHPTSNTIRWSRNDFTDPEDGAVWDEQDLNPIERGHVYLWKEDSEAWIHIFMPFKIMDRETAVLLNGFKTYRSTAPFVTGKQYALDKLARNPKSCLQSFKFTREYFSTFKNRVEHIGGILDKDEVDAVALVENIKSVRLNTIEWMGKVSSLREQYCSSEGETIDSNEKLQNALASFVVTRDALSAVAGEIVVLAKELERLRLEAGRKTAYIEANEWFTSLRAEVDRFRNVDFDRLEREVIHKHRRDSGDIDVSTKPPTMMPLSAELRGLAEFYPSLRKLSVHLEEVWLDLPGIKIKLLPDGGVSVEGDPGALKPYVDGSSSVKVQGRRRRAIYTKGDE